MKTGRGQTDLTDRTAVALEPRCGGIRELLLSQAEALRLQETELRARSGILTQKEGVRKKHIHACAGTHTHTHPEVDRPTHRHDDNQKLGTPHTECRTSGGREGGCWGTEARVRIPPNGSGVPTTLPCPKHLPPGPWQESSPLSAACNTSAWSLLSSSMKRCGRASSHLAGGLDSWQASCIGP